MKITSCGEDSFRELSELICASDGIVVTGHKNSDFDTVGACYGIYKLAEKLGRPAYVLLDLRNTLAGQLVELINNSDPEAPIKDPRSCGHIDGTELLTVIVDTNRNALIEFPELLKAGKTTVVIDHHRHMDDLDQHNGLYIHEPEFSSACEIVARLLGLAGVTPSPLLAEALWSGIMLDTMNFTQKVSAKTFYTVGSLCEVGADLRVISNFFDCSLPDYRDRAALISAAKIENGCAISAARFRDERVRILAPQAANELLKIEGVRTAFIIYRYEGNVFISARSDGSVDIARIMETLGGGGGRSMAAAQLGRTSTAKALRKLKKAIADEITPDGGTK